MAAGELLLAAFFQVLFERLTSHELLDFARREGVRSKMKKWEDTLMMIQALLSDAEEKQLTDGAVKIWLDNLQDLAYDVEDVLDEFSTEALRRKLMAEHLIQPSKVENLVAPCLNSLMPGFVKLNCRMGSRIKGISRRLEELCKQKNELGLQMIYGVTPTAAKQRPPSSCVPIEPCVYGRDEDKAKILEMVLSDEPSDASFCVIPIVGMAGVGKTTLAREVFNDKALNNSKFDIKVWIFVSDDFDVLNISRAILESITSSPCDLKTLNEVQVQLKNKLVGKRFLLVLDDVWNENYGLWENLKSPFMGGAPGSKIIVTTRHTNVASTMRPIEHYNLQLLSDDDCWSLFVKHAFEKKDLGAHRTLESIREKVVEKCRGLPLAARTLGGIMRSRQRNIDEWEDILNSKIWDLSDESEIPPVLKLSYYHLPSHLKRCFAYCSILPKDYVFEEKELALLWMAEGLIQQLENDKQLEDLGSEYFQDLLSRSMFQQISSNGAKFIMHDLVNDLAQWVCGDTTFRLEEGNKQSKRFKRVRHFSYICSYCDGKNKFCVLHEAGCLRTFLPVLVSGDSNTHHITSVVLFDLLPKLKKLRVLSLQRYYITQVPNSIGRLRHLRYINFSGTMIKSLPESISSLFNLQTMILRDCYRLMKLPTNMRNLINLRHLDVTGENLLKEMPLGMNELKNLRTLSNFIVGKGSGSGVKDLKNLKFLQGELCISGLENVIDPRDTKDVVLSDKKNLEALAFEWGSQFDDSRNEVVEKNVLNMLQPHRNLKKLTIKHYYGTRFPIWIGDPSYSNIAVLKLEKCAKCTSLPSLALLGFLKSLTIEGMMRLKSIGSEIYGEGCLKSFESLEILCFKNLQELEYWEPIEEEDLVERFPCLRELSIIRCPKLTEKLPDHLPSLETLVISECPQLLVPFSSFPKLHKANICECKGIVYSSPTESPSLVSMTLSNVSEFRNWLKEGFQKLESLKIVNSEELICLWQSEFCPGKSTKSFYSFASLKELSIENWINLVLFPEVEFLPNLTSLKLENCKALQSLPQGINQRNACLESLIIKGCHCLNFIVKGRLPSSLKRLDIFYCEKLQFLWDDPEENIHHISGSLEYLSVSNCPSLTCLLSRGQLPVTLKHLEIVECSEFAYLSSRSRLPERLEYLSIGNCSKLESVAERFPGNARLREIRLWCCENLKSMPEGLHNLCNLQDINILECSSLACFPERGLPRMILSLTINKCARLEALPNYMHNLNSLQQLYIWHCPSITSFPEEGFPTNLKSLSIGDHKIYKPLIEWGIHNLTSLTHLYVSECPDTVSFPEEGTMLPASLTWLCIRSFPQLKYLSSTAFQGLTSLECLWIDNCPKIKSFPEKGLPSSLLELFVYSSPLLERECRRDKGKEWHKIAHIPNIGIAQKFVYDTEEEE